MVKCMIVDDEPLARQVLESHIGQTPGLLLLKSCPNAMEAFEWLTRDPADLLFLDIKMPSVSGIDLVRSLRNPPAVIFTTAFSEYAVTSYELEAIDYLLKPVTFERFSLAITKFLKRQVSPEPKKDYSYFKTDGKLVRLEHADIISARSIRDYLIISTTGKEYIIHMTMKNLTELLPSSFLRVHRSYIVNAAHIRAVGRNAVQLGDKTIPVGDFYKDNLKHLS